MKRSTETSPVRTERGREERTPTLYGGGIPSLFDEMERMMEDTFGRSLLRMGPMGSLLSGVTGRVVPPVDLFEEGSELVLRSELPGMKREEIDVNITGNILVISGEKRREGKTDRRGYLRSETSYGTFSRSLTLPEGVDTEKVKATFTNGVLEIRMPKTGETGGHHITIH